MMEYNCAELKKLALEARKKMLDIGFNSNYAVHFGGGLSSIDLLTYLYQFEMNYDIKDKFNSERDRFFISKGHGVLSYYVALFQAGFFGEDILNTFQQNEGELSSHPVKNLELGIEASTGSLGQGLSLAVGNQIYAKRNNKDFKAFVLMGDGECDEGSVWEAAMFAAHYKLDNIVVIVDHNGLQSDGTNSTVMNIEKLCDKWQSFGWDTYEIDGHSFDEIHDAFSKMVWDNGKPKVIVARTIKGKGVSFMENNNEWHHRVMTEPEYKLAVDELEG